jgi:hypothetical protein
MLALGAASLGPTSISVIDVSPRAAPLIVLVWCSWWSPHRVPKIRSLVRAKVSEATSVLQGLRSPTKVALLIGGNIAARLLLAVVLSASLRAFGVQLPLAELLLVNTLVSLFAGIMRPGQHQRRRGGGDAGWSPSSAGSDRRRRRSSSGSSFYLPRSGCGGKSPRQGFVDDRSAPQSVRDSRRRCRHR